MDETLVIVTADHSHTLSINGYQKKGSNILGIARESKIDNIPYTTLSYATGGPAGFQMEVGENGKIHRKDPSREDTTSYTYNQQAAILTGIFLLNIFHWTFSFIFLFSKIRWEHAWRSRCYGARYGTNGSSISKSPWTILCSSFDFLRSQIRSFSRKLKYLPNLNNKRFLRLYDYRLIVGALLLTTKVYSITKSKKKYNEREIHNKICAMIFFNRFIKWMCW